MLQVSWLAILPKNERKEIMILERIDKYLIHSDIVDTVNSIGRMNLEELVESILESTEEYKYRVLSMLDKNTRIEVEKLIEGGVI